jgi:hypothetical protein
VCGVDIFFDYDALYRIDYTLSGMRVIGYSGLNGGGEIFPISVVNALTGERYLSYCANGGSLRFAGDNHLGCAGYVVDTVTYTAAKHDEFLRAFQYIEDNFGSLDDYRVITQVVSWCLLGSIDVNSAEFNGTSLTSSEKAMVREVMANYATYESSGMLVDVVFMCCADGHNYLYCQPQVVPVYRVVFENKTLELDIEDIEELVEDGLDEEIDPELGEVDLDEDLEEDLEIEAAEEEIFEEEAESIEVEGLCALIDFNWMVEMAGVAEDDEDDEEEDK